MSAGGAGGAGGMRPPEVPGPAPELRTGRLVLRRWREDDLAPFAELNGDPVTMRHFPAPLRRQESDQLAERIEADLGRRAYGLWAVEVPGVAPFVGFVGLARVGFPAPFDDTMEIGWRLHRHWWHRGYATEAARAALAHAFGPVGLDQVVSFTAAVNEPSRAVMARLGMHRDPDEDFVHPRIPADHRLQPHVLYRLSASEWREGQRG